MEPFCFIEVDILDPRLFLESGVEEGAAYEVKGLKIVGSVVVGGLFKKSFLKEKSRRILLG